MDIHNRDQLREQAHADQHEAGKPAEGTHGRPAAPMPPPAAAAPAHMPLGPASLPTPFSTESAQHPAAVAAAPARGHGHHHGPGPQGRAPSASWVRHWAEAPATRSLARLLVCAYFANAAVTDILTWRHFKAHPEALAGLRRWASDPAPRLPRFPLAHAALLLPAALAGVAAPRAWARVGAAMVMLAFVLAQDGWLVAMTLRNMAVHR
jgi:hypothetical protein